MNMKKGLLAVLCAAAVIASTVYATLAYFTDSEAVTNTFSVGQVHITLDELDVDKDTNLLDNKTYENDTVRDKANEYHLVPGNSYVKDPTVHVQANSNDAWLFVKVENGIADIEAPTGALGKIAEQITSQKNGWRLLEGKTNIYYQEFKQSAGKYDFVVFEKFEIDGDKTMNVTHNQPLAAGKYNIANYENATITVTAYAIQMAGFEGDPEAAWTAGNWS